MTSFEQFAADLLRRVAGQLGVTYEQMSAQYRRDHGPHVTRKMVRLGISRDRRQRKRAWRIYFAVNGRDAARSYFSWALHHAATERDMRSAKAAFQANAEKLFSEWLSQANDNGE